MRKNFTPAYHFTESPLWSVKPDLKKILLKSIFAFVCLLGFNVSMGQAGEALDFDGTKQNKVSLPFSISGSYTKEVWINTSDFIGTPNILTGSNTALYLNNGQLAAGHAPAYADVLDPVALTAGWHHVAVSFDAGTNLMSLYKDGILVSSATSSAYTETNQNIGAFGGTFFFTGQIDEVRYWKVVRSQPEIAASMNCELTGDEPNLIAYYNFNQGVAGVANPGVSTLFDVQDKCVPLNGTLEGTTGGTFELDGATSNWIAPGAPVSGTCSNAFPNIKVTGNSLCIVLGDNTPSLTDDTDFGTFTNGVSSPITRTFTIENTGNADLNVNLPTLATGTDFTVTAAPASVVPGGGSTTFQVTYNPLTCIGQKTDVITITNDDGDEAAYTFSITANCFANGQALDFDGVNDNVSLPVQLSGNYTKEAWINTTAFTGSPNILSGTNTALYLFNGQLTAGHAPAFFDVQDPVSMTAGWHHVAVSFDAGTNLLSIYKDGVLVGSNTSVAYVEGATQYIGAFLGALFFYTGQIDEVRIWNTVRSASDIAGAKDCELTGTEAGLMAYYHFNQGIAGGNNAGVTSLSDVQDKCIPANGTLNNFTLNGTTSNWIYPGAPVCAAVTVPNISVSGNSVCIVNGDNTPTPADNTDFGFYAAPGNDKSFIIYNNGTATLNITSVDLVGPDANMFAILAPPNSFIPAGRASSFLVRFAPPSNGVRVATIVINSDDSDEDTYTFDITGDRQGPVAVSILSFDGSIKDNGVRLTWKTTAELNNRGFEILRSTGGVSWTKIGFVASTGNANGDSYYFNDLAPLKGLNTYRLKQVDLNGNSSFSRVVALNFTLNGSLVSIYPNPVKDKLNLVFNDNALINTDAKLRNSLGVLVRTIKLTGFRQEVDLSNLPAGLYFLSLADGGVQRVIKK